MNKQLLYFLICVVILGAVGVFGVTLNKALFVSNDGGELLAPPSNLPVVQSSSTTIPTQLSIPKLTVDAKVQQVGITKKGAMGIPTNFTDVAWYKYGPVPGAIGNAVIDGHLDNAVSLPGVFKHLDDLQIGDDVYTINASGQQLHFKVTKKQSFNPTTSPQEVFGPSSTANLILITCEGTWNQSIKQYSSRLVVFSTLVE